MAEAQAHIEWKYSGKPNAFFGTGATAIEQGLVWFFGVAGTALVIWAAWMRGVPWSGWQYAIATLLALDILGGVVANSLNTCKRFYHAPLQPEEAGFTRVSKDHYAFVAFHLHPILVGLFFGGFNWLYGLFWYLAVILSTVAVLKLPLYLRRPASLGIIMMAILFNFYIIPPVPDFEWLVPALFLKIVYGHIVREEPYRP